MCFVREFLYLNLTNLSLYVIMYAEQKPSDAKAAFGFCRDNEQKDCGAVREHEVRFCECKKERGAKAVFVFFD